MAQPLRCTLKQASASSLAEPLQTCSYNFVMKLIFLGASFRIIWYMRVNKAIRRTYNKEQDSFRIEFLLGPCALLALLIHRSFNFVEVSPSLHQVFSCVCQT